MSLELILVYASQGSKNMEVFVSQKMNLTNWTNSFQMVESNKQRRFLLIIFFNQMVWQSRLVVNLLQMFSVNSLLMEQLAVLYRIVQLNAKFLQTFVSCKCMTQVVLLVLFSIGRKIKLRIQLQRKVQIQIGSKVFHGLLIHKSHKHFSQHLYWTIILI